MTDRRTALVCARSMLALLVAAVVGGVITWAALSGGVGTGSPAGSGDSRTPPAAPASAAATTAEIERVVDGDTVVVRLDGERERIRLLNIDTPETVDEDRPIECLGPEASDFTKKLLPAGMKVRLQYDVERRDQYGRMLAAVYTEDGRNASVEIAREGLASAVTFGENDRFRPVVQKAMEEAKSAHRGLFDPTIPCTTSAG